jgi:ABC transporter substrate binding protein (PQQ-dependent alcohol dehydrogenase system)
MLSDQRPGPQPRGVLGQKVTFRPWDGQLRQPIIVTGPDLPISISPPQGFLHEEAEVDTLGVDQPETKCKFK